MGRRSTEVRPTDQPEPAAAGGQTLADVDDCLDAIQVECEQLPPTGPLAGQADAIVSLADDARSSLGAATGVVRELLEAEEAYRHAPTLKAEARLSRARRRAEEILEPLPDRAGR